MVVVGIYSIAFVLGLVWRRASIYAALIPLTISPQVLSSALGIEGANTTIQKVLALVGIVIVAMRQGSKMAPKVVILAILFYGAELTLTLLRIDSLELATVDRAISSFGGYVLPFAWFFVAWRTLSRNDALAAVSMLPIWALGIGFVLQLTGVRSLFLTEYTGAIRLQAGAGQAYLGAIGMFGIFAALWLWLESDNKWILVAVIDLLITVLTLGRGPIVVSLVLLIAAIYLTRQQRRVLWHTRVLIVALLCTVALVVRDEIVVRFTGQGGVQGATSGREYAWQFFWEAAQNHPYFGNGIGSNSSVAGTVSDEFVREYFTGVHNTYLQLLVDFGWVGLLLFGFGVVAMFIFVRRRVDRSGRMLYYAFCAGLAFYAFFDNLLASTEPSVLLGLTLATLVRPRDAESCLSGYQSTKPGARGAVRV